MVLIPDGDYDKWTSRIYVNINLRRTNCTGRSSLNLRPANPASEEKFRSLYKIADSVQLEDAVFKLVMLAQTALYLFKLLDKDYIDGLICNQTNQAFWIFYHKYDPVKTTEFTLKEPWMEPHLLAAIISKLLMCRNKLQDFNFTTIKDPFTDCEAFRYDIGDYQIYKNMRATKCIDRETLSKLNEYTFSQLKVTKVIKSKLEDISGVTNSPLFIETSDPEAFRHHATIDSLRAIWRPRARGNPLYLTNTNTSALMDQQSQQTNELKHMLKRTTKTGSAVAADMLNKVAGSFPWINNTEAKTPSPSSSQQHLPSDTNKSSTLDNSSTSSTNSSKPSPPIPSPVHLDQDIPSYVQPAPKLRPTRSMESRSLILKTNEQGDFVPYVVPPPAPRRHTRSVSDTTALKKTTNNIPRMRSNSISTLPDAEERPTVYMNVETYLSYKELVQQHQALEQTFREVSKLTSTYERTARQLKETYEYRLKEFEAIQKASRQVTDEQVGTERRLKQVEDHSAKLHYELKVLNDKLKDIEDNVGTFYGKVGVLDRRMDDSEQSIPFLQKLRAWWFK